MLGCEIKQCRHYRDGRCAYAGNVCIYQESDNGEPNAIILPLKELTAAPFHKFTMPDWVDWGWNKAMREAAERLKSNGIPVRFV